MTPSPTPPKTSPVEYKGEPLDAARGPGLGCFWAQMVVLAALVVLTPLSVQWGWPSLVSAILLVLVLVLLLFTGQTMIFLLRLVAAGRTEGRRRPLASTTPTVGELEDEQPAEPAEAVEAPPEASVDLPVQGAAAPDGAAAAPADGADTPGDDGPAMRQ